jgi:hypothetical protein
MILSETQYRTLVSSLIGLRAISDRGLEDSILESFELSSLTPAHPIEKQKDVACV